MAMLVQKLIFKPDFVSNPTPACQSQPNPEYPLVAHRPCIIPQETKMVVLILFFPFISPVLLNIYGRESWWLSVLERSTKPNMHASILYLKSTQKSSVSALVSQCVYPKNKSRLPGPLHDERRMWLLLASWRIYGAWVVPSVSQGLCSKASRKISSAIWQLGIKKFVASEEFSELGWESSS